MVARRLIRLSDTRPRTSIFVQLSDTLLDSDIRSPDVSVCCNEYRLWKRIIILSFNTDLGVN